jgi:Circularly permutated YpsA SLOG family
MWGWYPKGRKAEDGPIDPKYPLKETPSASYLQRTEWNVRDSVDVSNMSMCGAENPVADYATSLRILAKWLSAV